MKFIIVFFLFTGLANCADIIDPSTCNEFPCLIFNDDFDFLDLHTWGHEITMVGGGNFEFQVYVNNRSVTYVRDGTFFIKPNLVSDWRGDDYLSEGVLDVWGMYDRNEGCTSNAWSGCYKQGTPTDIINPIMSGRVNTRGVFSFKYGRVDVRAQLPRGAWLWPAVWMLPQNFAYGEWIVSGEMDIMESRGNDIYGDSTTEDNNMSNLYAGSTIHWAPYIGLNRYEMTHADYSLADGSAFPDQFHIWSMEWNSSNITFYLDGEQVLFIDPVTDFFDFGNFSEVGEIDNPWAAGGKMTPFDQEFFLIMNLAVGGTRGYFPDEVTQADPPKPWENSSPSAKADFWAGRDTWLPTWQQGEDRISESAALKVDYIRVYKMSQEDISG